MEVSIVARTTPRPVPTETQILKPLLRHCPTCGETMWAAYHHYRTITTLTAVLGLTLQSRRCLNTACPQCRQPYRPEEEGPLALPKHEFGLDVMAFVGQRRSGHYRSVPAIYQALIARRVAVAPRTVTNLLERYDALVGPLAARYAPPPTPHAGPWARHLSPRWPPTRR